MNEFFQMGGYAGYIWSAYGISAIVLIALIVWSLKAHRDTAKLVASLEDGHSIYDQGSKTKQPAEPATAAPTSADDGDPK